MGFWGKLGCTTGLHDWSVWDYQSTIGCQQARYCKREGCTKTEAQVSHIWYEWSGIVPGRCDQSRSCQRCSEEDHRFSHLWDVWQYESPTTCSQVRYCRNCKNGFETKEAHSVSDHQLTVESLRRVDCRNKRGTCPRCREIVSMSLFIPEHDWGPWENRYGRQIRKCLDCGSTDSQD
jgi:hypothetical protein